MAAAMAAAMASCGDSTGPAPGPRLVLAADLPAGDSVPQLGVEIRVALRDSAPFGEVRVYADSAAAPEPRDRVAVGPGAGAVSWTLLAVAPGPGRHTITVAVTDMAGRVASASLTRTFSVPDARYVATALPDLGGGANALHVNAAGAAAGWVSAPGGSPRPAVWKGGTLTVLPLPGGAASAVARQVDAAGDVLLQLRNADVNAVTASVAVQRADGALVRVGPVRYASAAYPASPFAYATCCAIAGALNDRRVALGATGPAGSYQASARYDAASGRLVDTLPASYTLLNNRGQMAGAALTGAGLYPSTVVTTDGSFALPPLPAGGAYTRCDRIAGRYTRTEPVALDDSANVLVNRECGSYAYLSAAGSAWLDRAVGRSAAAALSPQGGLVAALDSAGAVYVWHAATRRAARVRLDGDWRVDSLAAVNAGGVIAAHGVSAGTGRAAALLLTPSAAP